MCGRLLSAPGDFSGSPASSSQLFRVGRNVCKQIKVGSVAGSLGGGPLYDGGTADDKAR